MSSQKSILLFTTEVVARLNANSYKMHLSSSVPSHRPPKNLWVNLKILINVEICVSWILRNDLGQSDLCCLIQDQTAIKRHIHI